MPSSRIGWPRPCLVRIQRMKRLPISTTTSCAVATAAPPLKGQELQQVEADEVDVVRDRVLVEQVEHQALSSAARTTLAFEALEPLTITRSPARTAATHLRREGRRVRRPGALPRGGQFARHSDFINGPAQNTRSTPAASTSAASSAWRRSALVQFQHVGQHGDAPARPRAQRPQRRGDGDRTGVVALVDHGERPARPA